MSTNINVTVSSSTNVNVTIPTSTQINVVIPTSTNINVTIPTTTGIAVTVSDTTNINVTITGGNNIFDPNAIHDNIAAEILAVTEKVTPISADLLFIEDSADSNNKKRIEIGNLPFALTSHTHAATDITSGTFANARISLISDQTRMLK